MTIIEFAMLRAARQRMTESEITIAAGLAEAAEAGSPIAADVLKRMTFRILFDPDRQEVNDVKEMTPRVLE